MDENYAAVKRSKAKRRKMEMPADEQRLRILNNPPQPTVTNMVGPSGVAMVAPGQSKAAMVSPGPSRAVMISQPVVNPYFPTQKRMRKTSLTDDRMNAEYAKPNEAVGPHTHPVNTSESSGGAEPMELDEGQQERVDLFNYNNNAPDQNWMTHHHYMPM